MMKSIIRFWWLSFVALFASAFTLIAAENTSVAFSVHARGTGSVIITRNGLSTTHSFTSSQWSRQSSGTVLLENNTSYSVTCSATGVSEYYISVGVAEDSGHMNASKAKMGDENVVINEKSVEAITGAEISAGGGVFTVRVARRKQIPFAGIDLQRLAEGRVIYFGMGLDTMGRNAGSLAFYLPRFLSSPTSSGYQLYFRPDSGTLDSPAVSGDKIQGLSSSGLVDATRVGDTIAIKYYSVSDCTFVKGSDGYYVTASLPVAYSYTLQLGSVPAISPTRPDSGRANPGYQVLITRNDGYRTECYKIQDYVFISDFRLINLQNPHVRTRNCEHLTRVYPWKLSGDPDRSLTEFCYLAHYTEINYTGQYQSITYSKSVYAGADRTSTLEYSEGSTYRNNDQYLERGAVYSSVNGVKVEYSYDYYPAWWPSLTTYNGYLSKETFKPDMYVEMYTITPGGGNLNGEQLVSVGMVRQKRMAFLDYPLGSNTDIITDYHYTTALQNTKILVSSEVSTQNGVEIGRKEYSYATGSFGGLGHETLTTTTRNYYRSGAYLTDTMVSYSSRIADPLLRGKPLSQTLSTGKRLSYGYQKGVYSSSGVWSANQNGGCVRIVRAEGTQGSAVSNVLGIEVPGLEMEDKKAMVSETILNSMGLVLKEANYFRNGSGVTLLSEWFMVYDKFGNLVLKTNMLPQNGAPVANSIVQYSAVYHGFYKIGETDELGQMTSYEYDSYGRIQRKTRLAVSNDAGTIPGVVTEYEYNQADKIVKETQYLVQGGEEIVKSYGYDMRGRISYQEEPGVGRTSYSYEDYALYQLNPDNGTITINKYKDGKTKSRVGTAIVDENYSYWYNTTGGFVCQKTYSDSRTESEVFDFVGKTVELRKATQPGNELIRSSVYNTSTGTLWAVGTTDASGTQQMPESRYDYEGGGRLLREGLDSSRDGMLTPSTDLDVKEYGLNFEQKQFTHPATGQSLGSAWYLCESVHTWPYGPGDGSGIDRSSQSKQSFKKYTRMSGLNAQLAAHEYQIDGDGNVTQLILSIDRSSGIRRKLTYSTGSTLPAEEVAIIGMIVSFSNQQGHYTDRTYDGFGRMTSECDPRGLLTTFNYAPGTNLVSQINAQDGNVKYFGYTNGRRTLVANNSGGQAYFRYNELGRVTHLWGNMQHPIKNEYDEQGRLLRLHTYKSGSWDGAALPSGFSGSGDVTQWVYNGYNGLVSSKVDALGRTQSYTYDVFGRLATVTDARNIVKSYTYYGVYDTSAPFSGKLKQISYSDGFTPSVVFQYHRSGKVKSVTDGSGQRVFTYYEKWTNDSSGVELQNKSARLKSEVFPAMLGGYSLNYEYYYGYTGVNNGLLLSQSLGDGTDYSMDYSYDQYSRLSNLSANQEVPFHVEYIQDTNVSGCIAHGTGSAYSQTRTLEQNSNRTSEVGVQWSIGSSANIQVRRAYSIPGRLTSEKIVGTNYLATLQRSTPGIATEYQTNHRNEITGGQKYVMNASWVSGASIPSETSSFVYDGIGNRTQDIAGAYTSNSLNQYSSTPLGLSTSYDNNGNLTVLGGTSFTYDAENRLVESVSGSTKVQYQYDYMGRRYRKVVSNLSGSYWVPVTDIRWIHQGWKTIAELNAAGQIQKQFFWGPDIRGGLADQSIVGALLQIKDMGVDYFPAFDGIGNIIALYSNQGQIAAAYEYDAFGNVRRQGGAYASANKLRQTCHYWDEETGLVYCGDRYYHPQLGRFISRDPIAEEGGYNLYGYCGNNPAALFDEIGHEPVDLSRMMSLSVPVVTSSITIPRKEDEEEENKKDPSEKRKIPTEVETEAKIAGFDARRSAAVGEYGISGMLFHGGDGNPIVDEAGNSAYNTVLAKAGITLVSRDTKSNSAEGHRIAPNSISGDVPGASTSAGTASGKISGLYIERGGFSTDEAYNQAVTDLAKLKASTLPNGDPTEISKIINVLENNGEYRVVIWPGAYNNQFEGNGSGAYDGTGTGGTVTYNPAGRVQYYGLTAAGASMGYDSLAHELTHAYEAVRGVMPRGFPQREYEPIRVQNQLRALVPGMILRTTHGRADIDNPLKYITWP